jgi:hypothetical protein
MRHRLSITITGSCARPRDVSPLTGSQQGIGMFSPQRTQGTQRNTLKLLVFIEHSLRFPLHALRDLARSPWAGSSMKGGEDTGARTVSRRNVNPPFGHNP